MKDQLINIGAEIINEAFDKYFVFNYNSATLSVTQKGIDKNSAWELARMQEDELMLPIKKTNEQGVINYLRTI